MFIVIEKKHHKHATINHGQGICMHPKSKLVKSKLRNHSLQIHGAEPHNVRAPAAFLCLATTIASIYKRQTK